jgi:tetratricopeptide (TPR) repeat protein
MQYRGDAKRDLRQIANALGVANVLEGTVRREGNRVRVSIELIDAHKDQTIWADSYDRDLNGIFAIQSEVAQTIAAKLTASLSPDEKKSIEAKPTGNLEAYDLYLRAKQLLLSAAFSGPGTVAMQPTLDAFGFLERAMRLDPNFVPAYCASAEANDLLYWWFDQTPERLALADGAINAALRLGPDLPEVHLAHAQHLYFGYRDYDGARVQLATAKRGLPNSVEVTYYEAFIDRRQGNMEKAIDGLKEALVRDPCNLISLDGLAETLYATRQFDAAARLFDRLIDLRPERPFEKVIKATSTSFYKTGDTKAVWSAIAALPQSATNDPEVLESLLQFSLIDHDWTQVERLIEKIKRGGDDAGFAYTPRPAPIECYSVLVARLRKEPTTGSAFAEVREQLNQRVLKSPQDAELLSELAVLDALLDNKEAAISEAKRSAEMLPVTKDALVGPYVLLNLAVVYAWTDEPDLAFDTLSATARIPFGIYYGELKRGPWWEPLRQDPRYNKLLAELAPKD